MIEWIDTLALPVASLLVALGLGLISHRHNLAESRLEQQRDLMRWVIEVRSAYIDLRHETEDTRQKAMAKLSLLIDEGRLYLPNDQDDLRSAVLDPLVRTTKATDHSPKSIRHEFREFIDSLNRYMKPFAVETSPEAIQRASRSR